MRVLVACTSAASLAFAAAACDSTEPRPPIEGLWHYSDYVLNGFHATAINGQLDFMPDGTFLSTGTASLPAAAGVVSPIVLTSAGTWSVKGSTLTLSESSGLAKDWQTIFDPAGGRVALVSFVGANSAILTLDRP